jgi:hypothetical protein
MGTMGVPITPSNPNDLLIVAGIIIGLVIFAFITYRSAFKNKAKP